MFGLEDFFQKIQVVKSSMLHCIIVLGTKMPKVGLSYFATILL